MASNVFGMAFSISAISLIKLDTFSTGFILLAGLFLYDIFWVFGTNVMVTVAKSFDVPVKLLFPRDLLTKPNGPFAMLGLGDIVIPGMCAPPYGAVRGDRHQPLAPPNGLLIALFCPS